MKYVNIGAFKASTVVMGCMRIAKLSESELDTWIDTAMAQGVNMFDHADIYAGGVSERNFGRALKKRPELRGQMILQTKCGICKQYYDLSAEHIILSVEESLKRLCTDHIDILLLHRPDALMEPDEIAEAFARLSAQGKVTQFGVSNVNGAQRAYLQRALNTPLCVNQIQFGIMHTEPVDEGLHMNTQNPEAIARTQGVLQDAAMNGVTIQAWSPLQYGMFQGTFIENEKFPALNQALREVGEKYHLDAAATALTWILRLPQNTQVILGTSSTRRIADSCLCADARLSREDWYRLYLAAGHTLP